MEGMKRKIKSIWLREGTVCQGEGKAGKNATLISIATKRGGDDGGEGGLVVVGGEGESIDWV